MKTKTIIIIGLISIGTILGATLGGTHRFADNSEQGHPQKPETLGNSNIKNAYFDNNPSNDKTLLSMQQTINQLQNTLQMEIEKRKKLEQKVALLNKKFNLDIHNDTENANSRESFETTTVNPPSPQPKQTDFNEQAMVNVGVDPSKINNLKDTYEKAEMDRLYLRDQATREGWITSDRYTKAIAEIDNRTASVRDQLTEKEYDAYLYATGSANRVLVESVIGNSPASNAGIQVGDTILKYNNQRIFSWNDLTSATSSGDPNETVSVTIVRNGQEQQLYIPRGPMGIRLSTDSVAP